MRIVIVDYGMGNIKSISSTLRYLGVKEVILSSFYDDMAKADKIILPGVGSFYQAMQQIRNKKIDLFLNELVINQKKPLLGICLGMQLLGLSSTEDGFSEGLGFANGVVTRFDCTNLNLKIPHVGFNQVIPNENSILYDSIGNTPDFYFTHSFRMRSDSPINASMCRYDEEFVASFELNNIAGVQFHPELSQYNGLKLLRNFIDKF